ncbi:MAG: hypothetical protein AW07_01779 [Candidatus Accumulibacter sp. SK-11]|nr:MAG: hypothetical protein AW07_01779 [Candidatus Accumulibacter sp. SK-11]
MQILESALEMPYLLRDRQLLRRLRMQGRQQLILDAQHGPLAFADLPEQFGRQPGTQTQRMIVARKGLCDLVLSRQEEAIAGLAGRGRSARRFACRR